MSRALFLTVLLSLVSVRPCAAGEDAVSGPIVLTPMGETAVRKLGEGTLKARDLYKGKLYLTRLEAWQDGGRRHALLTYYRYESDLGILVSIDLDRLQAIGVETVPHLPTSLVPEEVAAAEKRARANPEVARFLARYGPAAKIEVDALAVFTTVPEAFGYQHRVVRLHFRQGRDYLLYGPLVEVDLTTGAVRVERNDKGHN